MAKFEVKNTELYEINDELKRIEPSTLTEFGQNVSDNLTVLGNRISSIMSGSSDDSWDDKVKTQITSAIEKIGTSVKEEQKTAEVVKGASSILSTLKSALEEYVLGYDSWETHVNSEPTEETESYTKDDGTQGTRYTQSYLDKKAAWDKEDATLRKTVPELEAQAETWMEQMKTYFEAYNFETHEINTTIYKENKNPLKFYGDLYKQYESEYVPQEEKENVVPATKETPPVEETTEHGTIAEEQETGETLEGEQPVEVVEEPVIFGERRILTDEERKKIIAPAEEGGNNITDDPSIKIYVTPTKINGVVFNVYDVIDENNYDPEAFEKGKEAKLNYLSNVDHDVLQYVSNGGTEILLYSNYTCDASQDNGFAGYCNSINRNIICLNNNDSSYYSNAIIHECGHAFDFTLRYNATGETKCGITQNDVNYYENQLPSSFFGAVHEEYDALFDPLNFPDLDSSTFSVKKGYHGRGESAVNYAFSLYTHNDLIHEDEGSALEYFAESFMHYYTPEKESHDRFAFVIPKTFSYFKDLENMVKGAEINEN